jgi:hypothetical protein
MFRWRGVGKVGWRSYSLSATARGGNLSLAADKYSASWSSLWLQCNTPRQQWYHDGQQRDANQKHEHEKGIRSDNMRPLRI